MIQGDAPRRRYAVFAEGRLRTSSAKTAHGLLRYARDEVACVVDSTLSPARVEEVMPELRRRAPIVGTVEEALRYEPTSMLVGIAPPGGMLPEEWLGSLGEAARAGVEIVSGLHRRLAPEFPGGRVWDVREPPGELPLFSGEGFGVGPRIVQTVGTGAAVGKMTAALEVQRAAEQRGVAAEFVPTGQTGVVIAGWGVCVDAVTSDFIAGAAEQLVLAAAGASPEPDLILVEGQGSLGHPAYSGVTLGLLHGACPDLLILCTEALPDPAYAGVQRPDPARAIRLYEEVAALVKPAPVAAISVNTGGLDEEQARDHLAAVAGETGLPATDPLRLSPEPILEAVLAVS